MSIEKKSKGSFFIVALKQVMKDRNVRQKQLAEMINVKPPTINRLFSGERNPGAQIQTKIATALGYDLVDFLSLGRSLVEGDKPPISPEVAGYLDKARAVLEGPKGEALKVVIEALDGQKEKE